MKTMTNAEWCIKQGYKFRELTCKCSKTGNYDYDILLNNKCVGKVKNSYSNEAITTWLDMEHAELLLDDAEKRYLSAVIKPFRDRFQYITKEGNSHGEWIHIVLSNDSFSLPFFKPGTMYKNLTPYISYTLGDLGL